MKKTKAQPTTQKRIADMRASGLKTRDIVVSLGISKQRVYQIEKKVYTDRPPGRPRIDEVGKTYGAITVLKRVECLGRSVWRCLCKCGTKANIDREYFRSNPQVDCGCGAGKS